MLGRGEVGVGGLARRDRRARLREERVPQRRRRAVRWVRRIAQQSHSSLNELVAEAADLDELVAR